MTSTSAKKGKYVFKIFLLGDSQVGKTSMLQRYCEGIFKESNIATIGCDFKTKEIPMEDCTVSAEIWDTAGQERFKAMTKNMFRGADGYLLVYDITSETSFKSVTQWINDIKSYAKETSKIVLAGNKCDLDNRAIKTEQGEKISQQFNVHFMETSCKDNININDLFFKLIKDIYLVRKAESSVPNNNEVKTNKLVSGNNTPVKKKDCCSK